MPRLQKTLDPKAQSQKARMRWLLILAGIVLFAGLTRFAALDQIPDGVYTDEAINGVQGWEAAMHGSFQIFYRENYGREGLWINLIGVTERVLGVSQFSLRFWSAMAGTLTVIGTFLVASELFQSDTIALLTAFFIATSFWHLNFSRIAFPAILVPLFLTFGLGLLLRSWRLSADRERSAPPASSGQGGNGPVPMRELLTSGVGGACFGLGFYSYAAYRVAPLLALLLIALYWRRYRSVHAQFRNMTAVWASAAFLTALPLGLYFLHNPQDFSTRSKEVSIFAKSDPWFLLVKNLLATLGMFTIRGDGNWRHNIANSPQLLFPVGLMFLLGFWLVLGQLRRGQGKSSELRGPAVFILAWLALLLLPEVLTWEGIPHALRSIGAIPPSMMMAALGAEYAWRRWLSKSRALGIVSVLILLATGGVETYRYFYVWAPNPNTASAFFKPYKDMANYLNSLPPEQARVLIADIDDQYAPYSNPNGVRTRIPVTIETIIFGTLEHPPVAILSPRDLGNYPIPADSAVVLINVDPSALHLPRIQNVAVGISH